MTPYNTGSGDPVRRMSNVLWQMIHGKSVVTRAVCREIVAKKLAEKVKP